MHGDVDVKEPCNAGAALMNLPYLRETYDDFFRFILNYKKNEPYIVKLKSGKRLAAPSDQGAYLKSMRNLRSSLTLNSTISLATCTQRPKGSGKSYTFMASKLTTTFGIGWECVAS